MQTALLAGLILIRTGKRGIALPSIGKGGRGPRVGTGRGGRGNHASETVVGGVVADGPVWLDRLLRPL